jgi:hypothetical protein
VASLLALRLSIALALPSLPGAAATDTSPKVGEYQVKAVFLLNFLQFVDWPAVAFASPTSPITIGLVGSAPIDAVLEEAIRGETVKGRSLELRRLGEADAISGCHLLFVSQAGADRAVELVKNLHGQPVLIVGESEGFAEAGGAINFVIVDQKVRFEVNPQAAAQQGVKISSRLLQLGRLVGKPGKR